MGFRNEEEDFEPEPEPEPEPEQEEAYNPFAVMSEINGHNEGTEGGYDEENSIFDEYDSEDNEELHEPYDSYDEE